MNEVSQINSIEKPTILDQKELKKIVSGWQKLIVVSFFWALLSLLLTIGGVGLLDDQVLPPSHREFGYGYFILFLGLFCGISALSILSKTGGGTILGVLGFLGLTSAKQLFGKNSLNYKEINEAYIKHEAYILNIENRKRDSEFTKTAYMSVGSFICSIYVISGSILLFLLAIFFPFPPSHGLSLSYLFSSTEVMLFYSISVFIIQVFLLPASLMLGITALVRFRRKLGTKKDLFYAILGIISSGIQTVTLISFYILLK